MLRNSCLFDQHPGQIPWEQPSKKCSAVLSSIILNVGSANKMARDFITFTILGSL